MSFKAWHKWGRINSEAIHQLEKGFRVQQEIGEEQQEKLDLHLDQALLSFVQSISLEFTYHSSHKLQNLLKLITLWFKYGSNPNVIRRISESFDTLPVDVWL